MYHLINYALIIGTRTALQSRTEIFRESSQTILGLYRREKKLRGYRHGSHGHTRGNGL